MTRVLVLGVLLLAGCKKQEAPMPATDAGDVEREYAEIIARYEADCAYEAVVPAGDPPSFVSECRAPSEYALRAGLKDLIQQCMRKCTAPCDQCQGACAQACTACKGPCGDAGTCIHACAVARQRCRHMCWTATHACRERCTDPAVYRLETPSDPY